MFIINERKDIKNEEIINLYKKVYPSTIGHMTDFGFIKGLNPTKRNFHFAGPAVTIRIPHMDSVVVHKATEIVEEGDVVLISMSGDVERACVGEIVAYAYEKKRVGAIIIDGCITDIRAIRSLSTPIFSRGVSPLTTRSLGIEGAINVPISISGVVINPGDIVVGDDDGIFVVPEEYAEEYAIKALRKQEGELAIKQRLDNGENLCQINGNSRFFEGV